MNRENQFIIKSLFERLVMCFFLSLPIFYDAFLLIMKILNKLDFYSPVSIVSDSVLLLLIISILLNKKWIGYFYIFNFIFQFGYIAISYLILLFGGKIYVPGVIVSILILVVMEKKYKILEGLDSIDNKQLSI
jgi:hypothetical protein